MQIFSRDTFRDNSGVRGRLDDLPAWVRWGWLAVVLIALIFIGWLGFQGFTAKSNLEQARTSAQQAKDALLAGKSDDATRWAENTQFHARQARSAAHSLPWNIAAAVPLLGSPLKTTQQMSDVVVGLAENILLPAAEMGSAVSPSSLINGNSIDLQILRAQQPQLQDLSVSATKLAAEAKTITNPAYLSVISTARSQLQDTTARLSQMLRNAALASQLAPAMLGADGARTYLTAFQTPAEARGTGGILGAFG